MDTRNNSKIAKPTELLYTSKTLSKIVSLFEVRHVSYKYRATQEIVSMLNGN